MTTTTVRRPAAAGYSEIQLLGQNVNSYRDLPLRMSEFGTCMRNEAHGALHGLMRVTSMTQDDAHVFCTPDQVPEEVGRLRRLGRRSH